jgi:predicted TIM-barrel fold metal-dependent hydrolase
MVKLIDTHQHLIYPEVAGYGWTADIPPLADKAFPLERYNEQTSDSDVVGATFMETGVDDADYQAEARYVAGLAAQEGSSILGMIASCRPEEDSGFTDWLDECETLGVLGFRRILHVMPDDLSTTSIFRANIRKLGDRNKPFDLCMLSKQLKLGAALVRACDNTTIILNHCGVPDIASGGLDPWRDDITALAALPNVYCKLSGLLAYCAPGEATQAAIQPYVDHVLATFGPSRMVWGSDWPVVDLANGLPDWLDVTRSLLDALSEDEAHAIGRGNAAKLFGVPF